MEHFGFLYLLVYLRPVCYCLPSDIFRCYRCPRCVSSLLLKMTNNLVDIPLGKVFTAELSKTKGNHSLNL